MRLPDPERSRIVLIGAGTYTDPQLPDLDTVPRTITDLAALFTDATHGLVAEKHCTVLLDDGDLRTVGRRLRTAAQEAEDLLLVYFAGHGLVGGRRHDLYLALTDSEFAAPEFNSLEYDKLRSAVLDSPAAAKLIVLDCCFSGRAVTDSMAGAAGDRIDRLEVAGTYVLTSAQRDQVALSIPGEPHTAFSGRLIRLLREGVVGGPELLTVDDLYHRLTRTMTAEGLPVPLNRGTRTASLIALGGNRAFTATAAPELRRRRAAAERRGRGAGDWRGAVEELERVLAEQTRLLGAGHEDTLRTRQTHALCLGGAGDPAGAAQALGPVLAEQTRLLGADHEDTLRSRQYLAVGLGEAGRREEAIALLRVLLADRSRVLGAEHEDTLSSRHVLARNLAHCGLPGAVEEAVALLRQLTAERDRVLGADHPHTRRTRADLEALGGGGDGD
ncbi:tetratricopeptide repeat protein [Kitasatospora sp. A2-31]|uniref:caspase, EACC1-associated type n=1 Tax=Kitasatospora sp. A2-31 TaxID=2916414 RepID=UPI001EECCC87|nr:tetratricopeptide repeat protein [Kitasatospora sp. A2-31]MCG6495778.1 tetratricopeptide repeat protein [Kitasatospora sp. A2-31]